MDAKTASKSFGAYKARLGIKSDDPGSLITARNAGTQFIKKAKLTPKQVLGIKGLV